MCLTYFALIKDTYHHVSHLDEVICCSSRLKQAENYCWYQMVEKKMKETELELGPCICCFFLSSRKAVEWEEGRL